MDNRSVEKTMNVVFIMSAYFPYGAAFSSRARYFSLLLNNLGYHVHVIAPKGSKHKEPSLNGGKITIQRVRDTNNWASLSGIGTHKPYMEALEKYAESNKIDFVFSSSMVFVADEISAFCKKQGIPYFIEQCEWYDKSIFKGGALNPYYREHIRRIKKKNCKLDGIIAISRLFYDHYTAQGAKCIRIPTILDKNETKARIEGSLEKEVHLVFAGSLGKGKEQLEPVLKALLNVNKSGKRIVLDIYGPSEKQVIENISSNTSLYQNVKAFVTVHGRIPQEEIEDVVRKADFTIFIRPDRRSSNAGFPTKFAESMMAGTPVITNNTGDISLYLQNGVNGYMISENVEADLEKTFNKIRELSDEQYEKMRANARNTAEEHFDFRRYEESVKDMINSVSARRKEKL